MNSVHVGGVLFTYGDNSGIIPGGKDGVKCRIAVRFAGHLEKTYQTLFGIFFALV